MEKLPVLKATCLKFVFMFRNQLPDDQVLNFMQLAANHLSSPAEVNKSYAAAVIEKLLLKKNANHQPVLTKDNIG